MIPSARFGDITVTEIVGDYIICDLNSLYEGGVQDVASNREFCFFILVEIFKKLSMHDYPVMKWNGAISREEAKSLYEKLDKTTRLFYEESYKLLRGGNKSEDIDEFDTPKNEVKFKEIAQKIIETFRVSSILPTSGTFQEFSTIEFKVSNIRVIDHITHELHVSY